MQTDLFLLGPEPVRLSRSLLCGWAGATGREWVLLREWPMPVPVTGDPQWAGDVLLAWRGDAAIAPRARQALAVGDLSALLRLNYDMQIDGVLFDSILPWRWGDLAGMAANLQPHGGSRPMHHDLGVWLARELDMRLVDPVAGVWSDQRRTFLPLDGWRSVAPGALANPHWRGD